MIRFKRHRLTDAALVVSLGSASCTTELRRAGQFIKQPGVSYGAHLRIWLCHNIHPLFVNSAILTPIILHSFRQY